MLNASTSGRRKGNEAVGDNQIYAQTQTDDSNSHILVDEKTQTDQQHSHDQVLHKPITLTQKGSDRPRPQLQSQAIDAYEIY